MSKADSIRYGKALRFVRMAAQTLDEKVPDEYGDQVEANHYREACDALDAAAQELATLKSRTEK